MATLDETSSLEEGFPIHQTLHLKAGFYVFARVTHVDDRMTNRKLVILADMWIQTYDIAILNRFILIYLMVKAYGLSSTPVMCISRIKRTVHHNGMS